MSIILMLSSNQTILKTCVIINQFIIANRICYTTFLAIHQKILQGHLCNFVLIAQLDSHTIKNLVKTIRKHASHYHQDLFEKLMKTSVCETTHLKHTKQSIKKCDGWMAVTGAVFWDPGQNSSKNASHGGQKVTQMCYKRFLSDISYQKDIFIAL